jgi:hypothetical protein
MANVYNFTFENMSRIGNDECSITQTDVQNVSSCNYMTQNFFASDCSMKNPINLATTQPGVFYNGGHNVGAGGCNINDSSNLQIGTIQTNPRCRINLFHRPFATVPFLGRGAVNPIIESQIQQGELYENKRSVNNISEKSYIRYNQTPLLPNIKEKIDNPAYSVESVADNSWVRGGVPSRELTRDADFATYHTNTQYA